MLVFGFAFMCPFGQRYLSEIFFGHGQTGVCLFVFGVLCLFWGLGSPCGFSWDPLLRVVPVCLIVFYWNCNLACGLVLRAGMPADCVCAEILLYLWFLWFYAGFCQDVRWLRKRSRIGYHFWFGRVGDVTGIGSSGFMGTMCHNVVGSVSTQFMGIIYHEYMGSGSYFDMGIIGYDNKQKKSNAHITLLFFVYLICGNGSSSPVIRIRMIDAPNHKVSIHRFMIEVIVFI